jgi:carbamate kinase
MRIVAALGGNALLQRGQAMTAEAQLANIRVASAALASLTPEHELIIVHGNGPQVGLMALQSLAHAPLAPWPLDVLGAETEGMIGYMIEQEMMNALPAGSECATLLTRVEVDRADPAFAKPTKPIGPVYSVGVPETSTPATGWTMVEESKGAFRRVVPSPAPVRVLNLAAIRVLVDAGICVICAGGGGIPVARASDGRFEGVEAVIDKDATAALMAGKLEADVLLMLTDVDAVYRNWGEPSQQAISATTPEDLETMMFAAGSMAPKIAAAKTFVRTGGTMAGIGRLKDARAILEGRAGTAIRVR